MKEKHPVYHARHIFQAILNEDKCGEFDMP